MAMKKNRHAIHVVIDKKDYKTIKMDAEALGYTMAAYVRHIMTYRHVIKDYIGHGTAIKTKRAG